MRFGGLLSSVVLVALFVVLLWIAGKMIGFQVSLVFSLVASVVLTLVLNLGLRVFRRR